jgi:hypothetical protein
LNRKTKKRSRRDEEEDGGHSNKRRKGEVETESERVFRAPTQKPGQPVQIMQFTAEDEAALTTAINSRIQPLVDAITQEVNAARGTNFTPQITWEHMLFLLSDRVSDG